MQEMPESCNPAAFDRAMQCVCVAVSPATTNVLVNIPATRSRQRQTIYWFLIPVITKPLDDIFCAGVA
jgi:hypothetical protein